MLDISLFVFISTDLGATRLLALRRVVAVMPRLALLR